MYKGNINSIVQSSTSKSWRKAPALTRWWLEAGWRLETSYRRRQLERCWNCHLSDLRGPPGAPPGNPTGGKPAEETNQHKSSSREIQTNLRAPPGGPPRPGKPGGVPGNPAGGNPGTPGNPGAGPPTPAAGPVSPMGSPLPAGRLMPVPAAIAVGTPAAPPGALVPNLADGSAGGGPSTERETI